MTSSADTFFDSAPKPENYIVAKNLIQNFVLKHNTKCDKIVLVTSGGTTVPLEHNTVRFVDNFSAGTRGASSAEYFLQKGYAVIFLHRTKSLQPYSRHFIVDSMLDMLEIDESSVRVKDCHAQAVIPILKEYQKAKEGGRLLTVSFTTLADYLWLLRAVCEELAPIGPRALLFLAAAVADFYIPSEVMPEHKMQSNAGAPTISLELVPKMLKPLVSCWIPHAFVVSFKLETDPGLLVSKSREALAKYQHNVVIANILKTRREKVVVVTADAEEAILAKGGEEIERQIVENLTQRHLEFIADGR